MTRDKAYEVADALEDIHDFELFMDEIVGVYDNSEGNLDEFFHGEFLQSLNLRYSALSLQHTFGFLSNLFSDGRTMRNGAENRAV